MAVQLPTPPATAPDRSTQDGATLSAAVAAFLAWVLSLFTVLNSWVEELIQLTTAATRGTSTSSVAIGTGAKSFTASTGRAWIGGQYLRAVDQANAANYMIGTITSYDASSGALVINVPGAGYTGGSGTKTAWDISLEMAPSALLTLLGYTENVVDPAAGSAFSPDLSQGTMFNYDTSANATITLPTATVGQSFSIRMTYGGTHTLGFSGATVEWDRGVAPVPTSVNGAVDIYAFSCFAPGIWTGFDGGRNMS